MKLQCNALLVKFSSVQTVERNSALKLQTACSAELVSSATRNDIAFVKLQLSIVDMFHFLFFVAVVCSWFAIPEKPTVGWNTNVLPYQPAVAPPEYNDNGRKPPSRTIGVSTSFVVNYADGSDLFQRHHKQGWRYAIWCFVQLEYDRYLSLDDVRKQGDAFDHMMADDWNYAHYEYGEELGYHDARLAIDDLLKQYTMSELEVRLTEYPEIRRQTRIATIITFVFGAVTIVRYRNNRLNKKRKADA